MNDVLEVELGKVSFVTKLAGFEHSEYIQPNATETKVNDDDVPMFIGKNIKNGKLTDEIFWFLPLEISQQLFRSALTKKCLVLPYVGSVGDLAIFYSSKRHHLASNVAKIELHEDAPFTIEYLYYFLKSPFGNRKLLFYIQGGIQKNITMDAIRKTTISVQQNSNNIVEVLSALDDKIELNNKINTELEAMAKMLYDYWFVQFDFPNAEGKPYKSSGGEMVYDEVLKREVPKGWGTEKIGDLGTVVGGSTPSKAIEENFSQNGAPWITPKDLSLNIGNKFISKGELDVTEKGLKDASLTLLPPKSVLMSSRAPVGYLAINRVRCATNQGFKSLVCDKGYTCEYVYYVLKQYMPAIEANATGSTFKEISGAVLKSINIQRPQKEVADEFIRRVSPLFAKQDNLEQQNQELSDLRDWLLPLLMNGQVKVAEAYKEVEEKLAMVAEGEELYTRNH